MRFAGADPEPPVMAMVLAALHLLGASLALLWLLLPHTPAASDVGVLACITCAYAIGAALIAFSGRVPPIALRVIAGFTITFVISGAIYLSHATGSAFGLFYLWATLYVFYFFSKREVAVQVGLVALSYATVLVFGHSSNVWGEEAARWGLTLGTTLVSGGLIRTLTEGVRRSERRFRHGLDASSLGIALIDEEGNLQTANPALCELLGTSVEDLLGTGLIDVTVAEDRAALERRLREIRIGSARSVQLEQRCLCATGSTTIHVLVTLSQLGGERPFHALVQMQDVSQRRRIEEALRESEQRYRLVFERNPTPMWIYDSDTLAFLAVNQAAIDVYGYSREEFLAMTLRDIRPRQDMPSLEEALARQGSGASEAPYWRHRKKDGTVFDVEIFANALPLDGHNARLVLANDVTERRRAESMLRHQADHDTLTGLLNRRCFEEELSHQVRRAELTGEPCSVLVFDVDDLKYVNDSFGHAAGDSLLRQVGGSLRQRMRAGDLIARIGGDEFAVVLPATDRTAAERVARSLLEHLRSTVWHGLRRTTASIGVASFDLGSAATGERLLMAADGAMYEAKNAGRDRVVVSNGQSQRATWVEEIREAIDSDRLVLYAQPILDLRTNVICQEELLVRIDDGAGGIIPPAAFIPAAERFGLIHEIDRWVVAQALALAAKGRRVEVNLSARSIGDRHITQLVAAGLARGVKGENLILEITETAAAANFSEAREFAERLSRLGCGFALDDFGTGFGSFTYLKHVPATYLKIDMEFVRDLSRNPADRRVVKAIVSIAEGFGQRTIAEGVEDEITLELLRSLGVHYAQGYFVGRPEPLELEAAAPGMATGGSSAAAVPGRAAEGSVSDGSGAPDG